MAVAPAEGRLTMRKFMLVVAMVLFVVAPARAAEGPRDVIVHFYDGLVAVMKDGKQLGFQGRQEKLTPIIAEAFDIPEMTRLSLGSAAKSLTPEQTAALVDGFRRFTVANYAANFDSFGGERFDVGAARPGPNGAMIIPTQLTPGDNPTPIQLDYVMREVEGRWGITDILMEGAVSQVALRRSEFVSVLRKNGFDALLESIRQKTVAQEKKS
jgi:phospholipid transport system substrate-binding protein